jgi:hypothetical protein
VNLWEMPGSVTDADTGYIYNFEDDFEKMQLEKTTLQSVRAYYDIDKSAPSVIGANDAAGIGVNPYTGKRMYVPSAQRRSIYESDQDTAAPTTTPADHALDIDFGRHNMLPRENEERSRNSVDDDYNVPPRTQEDVMQTGCSSYWYDQWDPLLESYEYQAKDFEKSTTIRTREEISLDTLRSKNANLGDMRCGMINKTLESYGNMRRAPHQAMFHEKFFTSCLPHIYGSEWEWNQKRVLKQYNLTRIKSEVMVIAPRRFGKTVSVAMIVAAMALCVAGITQIVLSTGGRASTSLGKTIKKFVESSTLHKGKERICKDTDENLFIKPASSLDTGDADDNNTRKGKKKGESTKADEVSISKILLFPGNPKGSVSIPPPCAAAVAAIAVATATATATPTVSSVVVVVIVCIVVYT